MSLTLLGFTLTEMLGEDPATRASHVGGVSEVVAGPSDPHRGN